MMEAPKNTWVFQCLCEMQVLATVVIAMIRSKFGNHTQQNCNIWGEQANFN
jgi:hypothetical protein